MNPNFPSRHTSYYPFFFAVILYVNSSNLQELSHRNHLPKSHHIWLGSSSQHFGDFLKAFHSFRQYFPFIYTFYFSPFSLLYLTHGSFLTLSLLAVPCSKDILKYSFLYTTYSLLLVNIFFLLVFREHNIWLVFFLLPNFTLYSNYFFLFSLKIHVAISLLSDLFI